MILLTVIQRTVQVPVTFKGISQSKGANAHTPLKKADVIDCCSINSNVPDVYY